MNATILKQGRGLGLGLTLGALLSTIALQHDAAAQSPRTAVCFSAQKEDKMAEWITTQLAAGRVSVVGGGGYTAFFYCAW